jgi:hypothetical protein
MHTATVLSACIHSILTPGLAVTIISSYFLDVQHTIPDVVFVGFSNEDQSFWDVTVCYVISSLCFKGSTELFSVENSLLNDMV